MLYLHPEDPVHKPLEQYPPFMFYARFETTMAIYHYVYSGMAERHPNITVVAAHGGGAADRITLAASPTSRPFLNTAGHQSRRDMSARLV